MSVHLTGKAVSRVGGHYYRQDGFTADGNRRFVLLATVDDTSADHRGYDSSCPSCWLGYAHTFEAHRRAVA